MQSESPLVRQTQRVTLTASAKTFSDRLQPNELADTYRFRLGATSRLVANLGRLQRNLNLRLLNQAGQVLKESIRPGKQNEVLRQQLDPGVYRVQVVPARQNVRGGYELKLSARPLETSNPSPFNIQFDYRFDTNGWFTAERRAALEAAADIWERIIFDEFRDTPAGTLTPSFRNPQTGDRIEDFLNDTTIDDVLIFVGSRELGGGLSSIYALSGPSGYFVDEPRYAGSNFEPWIGTMAFDSDTNWFFDATPQTSGDIPNSAVDFISTATHELAHVLGFGTSVAFDSLVSGSSFIGSNTVGRNGGRSAPLSGLAHFADSYQTPDGGEPLMLSTVEEGQRRLPTSIDIAALADIGYTVDFSTAVINRTPAQTRSHTTGRNYRCGCERCLVA